MSQKTNSGLYFIVGALFVAVLVLGVALLNPEIMGGGEETIAAITTEPAAGSDSSSFELNITDEGFEASTSSEDN